MSLELFEKRKNNMAEDFLNEMGIKVRKSPDKHEEEYKSWLEPVEESILDPVHDSLADEIWTDDEKFNPKHRDYILDRLNDWLDKMGVDEEPTKVVVVGSITTYQYSDTSDIDVNVVIDIPGEQRDELISFLPNEVPLPGTKHPVNYYISVDAEENIKKRDSAYDLLEDEWIKKPEPTDVTIPYSYVLEIAKFFMDGIDNRIAEYERDKIELELYEDYLKKDNINIDKQRIQEQISEKELEIRADLDAIYTGLKMVKAFRGKAFEDDYEPNFLIRIEAESPDFSINNIVYKTIERFGYLEKLNKYKEIRDKLKDKNED